MIVDLKNSLRSFQQLPPLTCKTNILEFWRQNKNNMPQLHKLATVVLAVPSTQVSVERLFSSLKYILSPHRYNLRDEIVNAVIVVRANGK